MDTNLYTERFASTDDLAVQVRINEEASTINRSRPVKRPCVAASYGDNGQVLTWYDPQGTRSSCFAKLGIPGDDVDPPYALAVYREGQWTFDDTSDPILQLKLSEYIESAPWSQQGR